MGEGPNSTRRLATRRSPPAVSETHRRRRAEPIIIRHFSFSRGPARAPKKNKELCFADEPAARLGISRIIPLTTKLILSLKVGSRYFAFVRSPERTKANERKQNIFRTRSTAKSRPSQIVNGQRISRRCSFVTISLVNLF